jgi:hypothetical protein
MLFSYDQIDLDVAEARDNLLMAKVAQAHAANTKHRPDFNFEEGDCVMLSTFHRRQEYKRKGERRVAKFFPRFDGPYTITNAHPETSSYTLDMPNSCIFPTFHVSELKPFVENDPILFPSRELSRPGPILTRRVSC